MIDDNDFSDLLGDEPAVAPESPRPKRGRPTKEEAERRLQAAAEQSLPHYTAFRRPVGVTFFANILAVQPKQIQKRLEKCPIDSWQTHGGKPQPMYDFLTGMGYLIPPQGSIEDWLAQQNQASLPPIVSKAYWEMTNARIRALTAAGQLWHDEDVLMTFGRVAMLIRQESKLWIENLPGRDRLSDEQYKHLLGAVSELNVQIKEALTTKAREWQKTTAHSQEIAKELEGTDKRPPPSDLPGNE
ncbi:hypothetical protein EN780_04440 [Mesorhizobium sp. M4B.F.Ca.ET.089.01.1.1]|uniref:hypothetical protein n=1 Tax=Mesorhizobium sp. M4B.F.Ca.ET.089.01.1.1 TaxID=2496662 RepID=UPI000FE2F530|nr:hypothetical protein [Mesorhizobium sp. M4B.F.Ca.ET.089.01.1.1]RWX70038.1 hypothetical protein EN780_04440 [Mesorhizobium sp. M4B.F.Ca.ET.089.01.1.1]